MLAATLLWAHAALLERSPPELGRRAVLATAASALALRPAPARALDLDLAAETLKEGALCSSQSCILNTLDKLKPVLDIAGVLSDEAAQVRHAAAREGSALRRG